MNKKKWLFFEKFPTLFHQEKAKDDFDLFGEYVATKMRKLSHKLEEDNMEMIEYKITTTLMKKFKKQSNRNNVNTTPHVMA